MERALQEAQKGWGRVSPNPLVGCTILNSSHQLVSTGYHAYYGGSHAEVNAIKKLNIKDLQGAHVIVTLEPCAHEGQTPSCAKTLAKLPIASVTYAVKDPNPLVSGQGIQILKRAGKQVVHLQSYEKKAESLAEIFLHAMIYQTPFVAMKVAMSEDECIALQDSNDPLWLTNEESQQHVHYLRANYDAIVVGKDTVLKDNPKLNIRHPEFLNNKNKVVILDPQAEILKQQNYKNVLNIFKYHEEKDIYFAVSSQNKMFAQHPQCILVPSLAPPSDISFTSFDLSFLKKQLFQKGLKSLFVEGGATVFRSFLEQKQFQRIYIYKTPKNLFEKGLHWNRNLQSVENLNLRDIRQTHLGDNLFLTGVCASFLP